MTCLAMKNNAEIKAAAVVGGITDIGQFYNERDARIKKMIQELVGSDVAEWQKRSAVYWPEKINVPMLILHGNKDRLVPFGQSVMLFEALKKMGKDAEFYQLKGADHGGYPFWTDNVLNIVEGFIRRYL